MKIVAIIQARMTSTRLPGKVLKQVLNKTLLEYQIERVKRVKLIDEIVVATTYNDSDDPIVDLCKKLKISTFRGSENDVLSRYFDAANYYEADIIVRLTSDCPLIEPTVIDQTIETYLNNNYDYVSNTQIRTYPRGMDTEVFSFEKLKVAFNKAEKEYEREHVTPYLYLNRETFEIGQVTDNMDYSHYRLTVDTIEDFILIKKLLTKYYPTNNNFSLHTIIAELNANPELTKINAHIEQKGLGE